MAMSVIVRLLGTRDDSSLTLSQMVSIFFVADAIYDPIEPVASMI
jgi:hypothetical protein